MASRFLVIDLKRASPLGILFTPIAILPPSSIPPTMHDSIISSLRAYPPATFVALGKAADPQVHIELLRTPHFGIGPRPMTAVFSSPPPASTPDATDEGSPE